MCDLFLSERSTVELPAVSGRLLAASGRLRPSGSGRLLVGSFIIAPYRINCMCLSVQKEPNIHTKLLLVIASLQIAARV